jgi:hypothetical protein
MDCLLLLLIVMRKRKTADGMADVLWVLAQRYCFGQEVVGCKC